MAEAVLSTFVLVSRWLCASKGLSLVLTGLLIPTNPALSYSLSLLSSSPVLCSLFLGSWLEASLGAQLNEILHLHPLHPFFLWIIFQAHQSPSSAPCKAPLVTVSMFLDQKHVGAGTRGGKWRQGGPICVPHFNQSVLPRHCGLGAWSSNPLTWYRAGTRSVKYLQEAAVGTVSQEINQLPPFHLRSTSCHPLSPCLQAALGSNNSRWLWGQAATSQGALRSLRKPFLGGWRMSAQAAYGGT